MLARCWPKPLSHTSLPALYNAAENLVCKQGINRQGVPNGKIYCRIAWGECLAIEASEVNRFFSALPLDRYLNARNFADNEWSDEWTDEDGYNCPLPPLEVKPTWRGSRPVYQQVWNNNQWERRQKTQYRVDVATQLPTCAPYNSKKADC